MCVRESVCVKERETGLQLNQSCLSARSMNPLLVKTRFVWELKETGELLKLAEASLIENQQTIETPQHTCKHTHTVQSSVIPTGYRTCNRCTWRMLTAHAEQSWWISLFAAADGPLQPFKHPAIGYDYYSSLQQEKTFPPASQHFQLIIWSQLKSQTQFMKSCCSRTLQPFKGSF